MTNLHRQKDLANQLRKSGNIEEALPIYEELWEISQDEFDGAGLLYCLRKKNQFERAIPLARELLEKFPSFKWVRNEAIWTFINGRLIPLEESSLYEIQSVAQEIMSLNPDYIARNRIIFKVLKAAKNAKDWKMMSQWIDVIDPELLNPDPILIRGKEGWSDLALWYYYRIIVLIKQNKFNEAISKIEEISGRFPKQEKFFLRCKSYAYFNLNQNDEALDCYKPLIQNTKSEWWILHEYGNLLLKISDKNRDSALEYMYKGALKCPKYELGVTLYKDIGLALKIQKEWEAARDHLLLSKYVREKNSWNIEEELNSALSEIDNVLLDSEKPMEIKEAYLKCKKWWNSHIPKYESVDAEGTRKKRHNVKGQIYLGHPERPFCFINTEDGESYFCLKSDLPGGIYEGDEVIFDGYPSYDKKKQKESWKARNVREIN